MSTVEQPASSRRAIFEDEHEDFRESVRRWLTNEVAPHFEQWEKDGIVPRDVFAAAGANGFIGTQIPEEFGGAGVDDFRFNVILGEEICRQALGGVAVGLTLHNDVCLPYFLEYCNDEQKERWLPGIADGTKITAIAMTEPGAGSDLAGIKTKAVRDGDHYIVNGAKTFITNGINADLIVTAVKTDPNERHKGISMLVIEADTPGFERGRNLEKVGMHSQDTAELFFNDARVPVENLLVAEGVGFGQMVHNLAQERLSVAVVGVATAAAALQMAVDYVKERTAFGESISKFQNTRFVLAECKTEVDAAQAFLDQCTMELVNGTLTVERAASLKLFATEVQGRVIDKCLQLFGGYGYMLEYPIARLYADARVSRIYAGSNEIMKEIVGRSLT
ncbi:acyl-CoA dehydrogenase family protein [Paraconexibacter algicola]|uniref:Acyl-[acyl-carrier-protein] dehydrogenase MbtN n=1 Tax=Paraconexibacter algicola TaxID=2133960 RepID=A0A2T4UBZ1_9ACTN|nr:acyl-CoA dehydrogenase family protein [Paraconexibacter algicola]PTL54391.1 acyl-CoA dehydrogenase [Paraconexibacter algicola]